MTIRFAAALLLLATPVFAQENSPPIVPPVQAPTPKPATVKVTLQTAQGPIVLELEKERAPVTATNFLKYVDGKRLDGATIYRAVKVQEGFGLIQGGLRNDPKKILPKIAHEPTSRTGLTHTSGTVSMARAAPGSATMDFFITVGDQPSMDADPKQPGDNLGYAAFGHVVEGMELVKSVLAAPTNPGGPAGMEGQMLAQPIRIVTARRSPE